MRKEWVEIHVCMCTVCGVVSKPTKIKGNCKSLRHMVAARLCLYNMLFKGFPLCLCVVCDCAVDQTAQ